MFQKPKDIVSIIIAIAVTIRPRFRTPFIGQTTQFNGASTLPLGALMMGIVSKSVNN